MQSSIFRPLNTSVPNGHTGLNKIKLPTRVVENRSVSLWCNFVLVPAAVCRNCEKHHLIFIVYGDYNIAIPVLSVIFLQSHRSLPRHSQKNLTGQIFHVAETAVRYHFTMFIM